MRIVVTSDWHGDWSTLGHRRHEEVCEAVAQSVELAVAEKADAYLCLGDVADPDTGGDTFRSVALALRTALALREAGIPSVWIAGNHDVCEDGSGASTLTPLKALEDAFPGEVHVASVPRLVRLPDRGSSPFDTPVSVLCLPFTPASHGVDVRNAVEELLLGARGHRVVVAAHLMLPGIHPGSETEEMPRGREVLFPMDETRECALLLNGHYHARQIYETPDGQQIIIPGSLARLTFGEEKNDPGILVVEVPATAP
jgi:exonuclease SbcD